jgi:hypothetical protein
MSRQGFVQAISPYAVADGAAVTAATTLTDASPLPAMYLPPHMLGEYPGVRFEFLAWGYYTTNATATTLTFGAYSGTIGQAIGSATVLAVSSAITMVASSTNRLWRIEGLFQMRTIGASGTGIALMEGSNISSGGTDFAATAAASTFTLDTTAARYLTIGFNVSSAQSITCRYIVGEVTN